MAPSGRRSLVYPAVLALVSLGGALLRLHQLGEQIVGDDEWHAVRVAAEAGFVEIATSFRQADNCIPLTLFYKLLLGTLGLDEWGLHGVQLVAGVVSVPLLALAVRPLVGREASLLFAAGLAASPLLVYYSRYARPYGPTACLGFGALVAFALWLRSRHAGYAVAYAGAAALAGWLSPVSLPALLAPIPVFLALSCGRRAPGVRGLGLPPAAALIGVAALTAAAVIAWLAPARGSLGAITRRIGKDAPDAATWRGLLDLFAGTEQLAISLPALALVLAGLVWLARREAILFLVLASALVAQYAALLLLQPYRAQLGIVLARYSITCLPVFLLALAVGLRALQAKLAPRLGAPAAWTACALGLVVLLLGGSLPRVLGPTNSFSNHDDFNYDARARGRVEFGAGAVRAVPAFYRELAARGDGGALVEFPSVLWWSGTPYHRYQRLHGRRVLAGHPHATLVLPWQLQHPGLALRNHVDVSRPAELLASGAEYVVFHKDLAHELGYLRYLDQHGGAAGFDPRRGDADPLGQRLGPLDRAAAPEQIASYRERFGPPAYEDEWLAVFAVERIRDAPDPAEPGG